MLLKGGLINSPRRSPDKSVKLSGNHDISAIWQRRADLNSAAFSEGVCSEPAPSWVPQNKTASKELPTHHPDFDPPTPNDGALNFVSLTARLSAALRAVRGVLARTVSGLMVRRGLASLPPNFFTSIKQNLENLENGYPYTTTAKNDESNDRALRPDAQGFGEGDGNRYRRKDRGNDGGSKRNQRVDGALYKSDGGFGADNTSHDVNQRDAAGDDGPTRRAERRHQMAMSAAEPVGLSRVRFVAVLRSACDLVFPEEHASITMSNDGNFRVFLPRGSILISGDGMVVGDQDIELDRVTEFVNALPEFAKCHLSLPKDSITPDFF